MTYAQKRNLFLAKFDFLKPYGFFVKNKKLFYVDFPGKIFIVISLESFHGISDVELDIYPFCWDITAEMMKEINGNLAVTNILYRKIGQGHWEDFEVQINVNVTFFREYILDKLIVVKDAKSALEFYQWFCKNYMSTSDWAYSYNEEALMAAQAGDYQTASAYLEPAIVVQRESIDTWRLRMESAEDDDEKERFRQNQLGAARHLEDLLTWKAMYDEGDADTIQAFLAPKIARTEQVVKDYFGKLLQ